MEHLQLSLDYVLRNDNMLIAQEFKLILTIQTFKFIIQIVFRFLLLKFQDLLGNLVSVTPSIITKATNDITLKFQKEYGLAPIVQVKVHAGTMALTNCIIQADPTIVKCSLTLNTSGTYRIVCNGIETSKEVKYTSEENKEKKKSNKEKILSWYFQLLF